MQTPNPTQQQICGARTRAGTPCENRPMRGQTRCRMHGGASPQARACARERLEALAEPAIEALRLALEADDLPATIRAAQLVLDRTGFHPRSGVEVTGSGGGPLQALPPVVVRLPSNGRELEGAVSFEDEDPDGGSGGP